MSGRGVPPSVLVIAPACFPRTQPEAHVNANLVLALHEAGWDVHVVTDPGVGSWYPGDDLVTGELAGRVHGVTTRRDILGRGGAVARGALRAGIVAGGHSWAYPAFRRAMTVVRARGGRRFDAILSRALPGAAHLAGLLVHEATGLPWVANWNDPVPFDVKAPPPYGGGADAPLPRGHAAFLARVGAAASWHTFPCERIARWIRSYVPQITEARTSIVPHVARAAAPRAHAPPADVLSLVMAGSLRPPRSPRTLLEGLGRVVAARREPRVRLTVITDQHAELRAAAAALGVADHVVLRPPMSYDDAFAALGEAHVGVIVEAPVGDGVFLPSKVVDYAQWALPILAVSPGNGTVADLLAVHGGGIAADVDDPAAVAAAIDRLAEAWTRGELQARYGSARLAAQFARPRIVAQYAELVGALGGDARRPLAWGGGHPRVHAAAP